MSLLVLLPHIAIAATHDQVLHVNANDVSNLKVVWQPVHCERHPGLAPNWELLQLGEMLPLKPDCWVSRVGQTHPPVHVGRGAHGGVEGQRQ